MNQCMLFSLFFESFKGFLFKTLFLLFSSIFSFPFSMFKHLPPMANRILKFYCSSDVQLMLFSLSPLCPESCRMPNSRSESRWNTRQKKISIKTLSLFLVFSSLHFSRPYSYFRLFFHFWLRGLFVCLKTL